MITNSLRSNSSSAFTTAKKSATKLLNVWWIPTNSLQPNCTLSILSGQARLFQVRKQVRKIPFTWLAA